MSQRLGIAAALLGDPRTVILDEPVNGLDVEGIRWIRALLQGLAGSASVPLTSHDRSWTWPGPGDLAGGRPSAVKAGFRTRRGMGDDAAVRPVERVS